MHQIMIFLYFHDDRKHIEVLNNTETVGSESTEDDKEELQRYMTNNTLASSQNAFYAIKKDGTVIASVEIPGIEKWRDIIDISATTTSNSRYINHMAWSFLCKRR